KFQQYDYGKLNMKKYGQPKPPEYNLKAVTAPVSIMYAEKDIFYGVNDVLKLSRMLPNVVEMYKVPWKTFNHIGYFLQPISISIAVTVFIILYTHLSLPDSCWKPKFGIALWLNVTRAAKVQGLLDGMLLSREMSGKDIILLQLWFEKQLQHVQIPCRDPATVSVDDARDMNCRFVTEENMIHEYGYPAEIHSVNTTDGYILELHRIPYSSKSPATESRPVAFLQHGLLCSSADWVILGPQKALGYLLADAGYDVWMGNARGNTYSKNHTTLSTSYSKFWDFSWHEMGVYDLPAVLDYILSKTGQKDLYYVGHSMGTTMFFVLASSMPQYNSKIRLMTSLAPIVYLSHATSPFPKLLSWNPLIYITVDLLGVKQFLPSGEVMTSIANTLCSEESIVQQVCSTVLFALCGFDADQLNMTMLPVFLSHTPAGSSAKTLQHYGQEMASGHFRQYDHGLIGNELNYGQFSPPDYNLNAITAPVHLVYGDNDWFGNPDVQKMFQQSIRVLINCVLNSSETTDRSLLLGYKLP
ncbi:hypothetical protein L9F63_013361, partial [Diploptera punctata]